MQVQAVDLLTESIAAARERLDDARLSCITWQRVLADAKDGSIEEELILESIDNLSERILHLERAIQDDLQLLKRHKAANATDEAEKPVKKKRRTD